MRATTGESKEATDHRACSTSVNGGFLTMPSSRKNLQKVQASLDAVCPKCGKVISPAEVRRIDFEHVECPAWPELPEGAPC